MPGTHMKLIVAIATTLFAASAIGEDTGKQHMHNFAKDVDAFHAVLAPLWHAPSGKERAQNVCAQAPKLESLAKEVHSDDAKPLLASVTALKAQCQANPSDIDAAFSQVHDAFHHLVAHQEH